MFKIEDIIQELVADSPVTPINLMWKLVPDDNKADLRRKYESEDGKPTREAMLSFQSEVFGLHKARQKTEGLPTGVVLAPQ